MTQQKKCTILCFIMVSRKNLIKNIEWERRHLLALGVSPAILATQPKKMGTLEWNCYQASHWAIVL